MFNYFTFYHIYLNYIHLKTYCNYIGLINNAINYLILIKFLKLIRCKGFFSFLS